MVATSIAAAVLVPTVLIGSARRRAAASGAGSLSVVIAIAVALALWYGIASAVATAGGFRSDGRFSARIPAIALGVGVPVVVGLLAVYLITPLRRLAATPDVQPGLIAVQTYRVVAGGVFLYLTIINQLPIIFGVPAGCGDVLVGLAAFWVAGSVQASRRRRAIIWNLLGLLDFVVAVGIGAVTAPGTIQLIHTTPTSLAISIPPLVIIPTFVVPLSVLLHAASLRYLLAGRTQAVEMAA